LTAAPLLMAQNKIDTSGFERMARDLAFIHGKDFRTVVRDEATAILSRASSGTKAAKVAEIKAKLPALAQWFKDKARDGKFISEARRKRKTGVVKKQVARALLNRGMAKGTFYLIGRQLGLSVKASKYAVTAAQRNQGKLRRAVAGTESGTSNYTLTIKNYSIVAMTFKAGGFGAFKRALKGRRSYFERRLKEGFKERTKKAAKGRAKVT